MSLTGCVIARVSKTRFVVASALVAALATLAGCQATPAQIAPERMDESLKPYVLTKAPAPISHRTFIDFEGKVQLIGYDLAPEGTVRPGESVTLKLYWQSSGRLGKGWKLFTHLLADDGETLAVYDNVGPLRQESGSDQVLGPSKWQPGHIYVDEQNIKIVSEKKPVEKSERAAESYVTIAVGVWNDQLEPASNQLRLDVTSGPHDSHHRALIARLPVLSKSTAEIDTARRARKKSNKGRRPERARKRKGEKLRTSGIAPDDRALRRAALLRAKQRRDARKKAKAEAKGGDATRAKLSAVTPRQKTNDRAKSPADKPARLRKPAPDAPVGAPRTKSKPVPTKTSPKGATPTGQTGKPAARSAP